MTVLFADVSGSTAMGEEMDPEEVRALLGRYYEIAKAVVAEHGGTLEKFIGDAVMAVFGLPTATATTPSERSPLRSPFATAFARRPGSATGSPFVSGSRRARWWLPAMHRRATSWSPAKPST